MENPFINTKLKPFFEKLFDPSRPKWIYFSIVLFAIAGIFTANFPRSGTDKISSETDFVNSTDTYIPNGYVLVPLEISNAIAVSSLMGQYTFVDIYTTSGTDGSPQKIIAQGLRMIRAPHNDEQFAVLVAESEHELIQHLSEQVFVVIKNPKSKQNEMVIKETKPSIRTPKTRITYGY
jgi:hypothetical protein